MSRLANICLALLLLLPILVVIGLVAVIVGLLEKSSPIFVQTRLGHHEKTFKLFKIRTMYHQTSEAATHLIPNSAVTSTGRILRKLKIDELPQIINVLNGTMNFVGPRPGLPSQTELTNARRKHGVFNVMPGITGYSQIRNIDMSEPEILAIADAEYVRQRSLLTDIQIILKTVVGGVRSDKIERSESGKAFEGSTNETKSGS